MTGRAQLLQRALDATDRGDGDAATAIIHLDVVAHVAGSLPFEGDHRGLTAYLAMLGALNSTYALDVHDTQIIDGGDRVVLRLEMTVTVMGTGRSAEQVGLEVLTFADGLVVDVDVFYKDTQAMLDLLVSA